MAEVLLLQFVGALLVLLALVSAYFILNEVVLALRQLLDRRGSSVLREPLSADAPSKPRRQPAGDGARIAEANVSPAADGSAVRELIRPREEGDAPVGDP